MYRRRRDAILLKSGVFIGHFVRATVIYLLIDVRFIPGYFKTSRFFSSHVENVETIII